jgi:quercetin dioxygenase-like cupin family protein
MMSRQRKPGKPPVLPEALVERMVEALAPIAPPASRTAAIRKRLLARVAAERPRFVTVRGADGTWQPLAPGIAVKVLDDDGAMQAFLLRLDAGARLPRHEHAVDEMCVVLEGTMRFGDIEIGAGDYHLARAGSVHGDVWTRTGALIFLRSASGTILQIQP